MSSYPVERNLVFYSNERGYHLWQWLPSGIAVNWSGYTFALKIRKDQKNRNSAELADWGQYLSGDTSGNLTLNVPLAVIQAQTWTLGWYDVVVTDGSSNPLTFVRGSITIAEGMS